MNNRKILNQIIYSPGASMGRRALMAASFSLLDWSKIYLIGVFLIHTHLCAGLLLLSAGPQWNLAKAISKRSPDCQNKVTLPRNDCVHKTSSRVYHVRSCKDVHRDGDELAKPGMDPSLYRGHLLANHSIILSGLKPQEFIICKLGQTQVTYQIRQLVDSQGKALSIALFSVRSPVQWNIVDALLSVS